MYTKLECKAVVHGMVLALVLFIGIKVTNAAPDPPASQVQITVTFVEGDQLPREAFGIRYVDGSGQPITLTGYGTFDDSGESLEFVTTSGTLVNVDELVFGVIRALLGVSVDLLPEQGYADVLLVDLPVAGKLFRGNARYVTRDNILQIVLLELLPFTTDND